MAIIAASFEYHSTPQPTRGPCVARRDAFRKTSADG